MLIEIFKELISTTTQNIYHSIAKQMHSDALLIPSCFQNRPKFTANTNLKIGYLPAYHHHCKKKIWMLTGNFCKPGQEFEWIFSITEPDLRYARQTILLKMLAKFFIKTQSTRVIYNCYKTSIFGCLVVFETLDYVIVNESECHLR